MGGDFAKITDFPWQLSLQESFRHVCGASILTKNRALTAAHCYDKDLNVTYGQYTVVAGSTSRIRPDYNHFNVSKFIMHPHYNDETSLMDIAVIWLEEDLIFDQQIRPIRLPTQNTQIRHGLIAFVAGWGHTSNAIHDKAPRHLKWAAIKVISNKQCNIAYEGEIYSSMLCAGWKKVGKRDTCKGDSGGALVSGDEQIGIVSWGKECGDPIHLGVYTRVSSFTNWINSVS